MTPRRPSRRAPRSGRTLGVDPLPIDDILPDAVAALRAAPSLVIEAPPGAGKTTRVPPAILAAGLSGRGEVVVLEPRRLAARLAARRVAEELGERVGETVGYQVRFEEVAGPRTRLRFVTEGLLTRRLLADPALAGVGAVVLDEFHERHLQGDLALALLRRLQRTARPDLKLVAMSATLDAGPVARFLGAASRPLGGAPLRRRGRAPVTGGGGAPGRATRGSGRARRAAAPPRGAGRRRARVPAGRGRDPARRGRRSRSGRRRAASSSCRCTAICPPTSRTAPCSPARGAR